MSGAATTSSQAFDLDTLRSKRPPGLYQEFLRVPSMSVGVYRLPRGSKDPQKPHREDELYVVLRGRGILETGGRRFAATPGSVLFVPAKAEHRFVEIQDDLEILVFFAPAESTPP